MLDCILRTRLNIDHLQVPEFEALWAWISTCDPLCDRIATIYHPYLNDSARDVALLDYLSTTPTTVEDEFPGCAIVSCGDVNRLEVKRFSKQFRKCDLVDKPAMGNLFKVIPQKLELPMNLFETFPECVLPSSVSENTIKMMGHHASLRDMTGRYHPICSCTRANHTRYSSVQVIFCGS